jgi:phage-related protein
MRETFVWHPDIGAQREVDPAVEVTKFGDGYESRTTRGINPQHAVWTLTFTRQVAHFVPILDFIEARGARESFDWIDPLNRAGVYVCRKWTSFQQSFGIFVINATFEQISEYGN